MLSSRRVLGCMAIMLIAALLIPLAGCGGDGEAVPCKISSVSGEVQVLKSGSTQSINAANGMELAAGDTVNTGSNGSAKLTFFEGSVMEIKADSKIVINELSTATSGSTTVSLNEVVGNTVNRIGKLTDSASRYEVETPAAVAVVRGTVFDLLVQQNGHTTVKARENAVDFTASGVTVTVNEGLQSSAAMGGTPSTPVAIATPTSTQSHATPVSTSASEETLGDIYGVGRDIGDVKFDMVMTSPEMTEQLVEKVYYKDAWLTDEMKIRYETPAVMEGAFSTIFIMDLGTNVEYMWYPDQNIACQLPIGEGSDDPLDDVNIIPQKVGSETLNGKTCDVYQYTFEDITEKVWVWKEKSFPIRMEMIESGGTTMVVEYQNIVFGNLSDSLFTIPSNVQMQPFPCYPMPSFSFDLE